MVLDNFIIEMTNLFVSCVDISIKLLLHPLVVIQHGAAISWVEVLPLSLVH